MNKNQSRKKKTRISKLAQCIRRTTLSSRLPRTSMPNAPSLRAPFEASEDISAKFARLIQQIKELDAEDMRVSNTKFKHFVFTDIRESAYGAKALASFLIGAGFEFRMEKQPKMMKRLGQMVETKEGETVFVEKPAIPGGSDSFAILQSLPLWKNPLSVKTKKDILKAYNSRPENANGELLRIVVLDSKFKEGIDLFDVKYVHILEPAIATSDLKQAVGRATRFCGQKGLNFVKKQGWPLDVFIYTALLPNRAPFRLEGKDDDEANDSIDSHALMLAHSGLDLALMNLTKELTVLAISSSVDYDLNYKINNFDLQTALLESTDVDIIAEVDDFKIAQEAEVAEVAELAELASLAKKHEKQAGGGRLIHIHSPSDITPALMKKCAKRQSKLFPFSKQRLYRVAKRMGLKPPSNSKREWFCEQLRTQPLYLAEMIKPESHDARSIVGLPGSLNGSPNSNNTASSLSSSNGYPVSSIPTVPTVPSVPNSVGAYSRLRRLFPSPQLPSDPSSVPSVPNSVGAYSRLRRLFPPTHMSDSSSVSKLLSAKQELGTLLQLSFQDFQRAIVNLYEKYRWNSPIVKNGCEQTQKPASSGTPVTFTQTQDFIRHYLTPESPFKGLLAWHSVGTGKTCMAIATASTAFEQAGYNILWVTRNSLMADVYKNMFGSVCSVSLIDRMAKGLKLPKELVDQKRLLSKSWFSPISYRTFQNALQEKNELGRILHKHNPTDPLRKTLLIMDEIHKLQDGDLGPAESADFATIRNFIHESYKKSGNDSVRPLLMTATPITDSPSELFEILNTLIGEPGQRLMPFSTFRSTYTNDKGQISPEGITYFQERVKGIISYLNREYDPSTFAQPRFHTIEVPIRDTFLNPIVALAKCIPPKEFDYEERKRAINESNDKNIHKKRAHALLKKEINATRKLRIKTAKECYKLEKKRFTKKGQGQIAEIEECFGKKGKQTFVPMADFLALV